MVARFTTHYVVRPFARTEWPEYQATRLAALKESPDAFVTTYEEALNRDESEWQARFDGISQEYDLPLVALYDGEICGMAWVHIEPGDDVAHLMQMWVSDAFRGRGIGRTILAVAIDWSRKKGVQSMVLGVTCGETPARRLYESAGFKPVGELEPLRPGSELEVQEMELRLDS